MEKLLFRNSTSHDKNNIENFKIKLQKILGEDYIIKTRIEQHQFLYKLLNSEKLNCIYNSNIYFNHCETLILLVQQVC